jgi:hypothetical protein
VKGAFAACSGWKWTEHKYVATKWIWGSIYKDESFLSPGTIK